MENQKIKSYSGNLLLPFGKAIVIVTGWETEISLCCERFVLFETLKGEWKKAGTCTHINKDDHRAIYGLAADQMLDAFMQHEGKELAETDIFVIVADMMQQLEYPERIASIDTSLKDQDYLNSLLYLKWKKQDVLKWLFHTTQHPNLKSIISIIGRTIIHEEKYP